MSKEKFERNKLSPSMVFKRADVIKRQSNSTSTDTSTTTSASSSTSPPTTPPPTSSSTSSSTTTSSSSSTSTSSSTSASSSSSSSSSTTPPPQNTSTSTSASASTTFQTTIITTNAQGSVVTIQTTVGAASTAASTATHTTSTSHTGAIVGGAVGGVAAVALLGLLLLFCLRRQRRKDDFDGNFDPDRVAHGQGPLDLAGGAGEVEPYTYPHAENGDPGMREGPVPQRLVGGGAGSEYQYQNAAPGQQYSSDYDSRSPTDTHTTHTTGSFLIPGAAAGAAYAPSSTTQSAPRSAKEREAFARYNGGVSSNGASGSAAPGFRVANQEDEGDHVVVHQDGGRVRIPPGEEGPEEREIPPTYDSIPPDEVRR